MENKEINRSFNLEEILNSVSHGLMAFFSVAGFTVLIISCIKSQSTWTLFCGIVYGLSLIVLYFSSTIYHAVRKANLKHKFRILDHASIYLLIAGTYTPVALLCVGGTVGWTFFIIQWGLAIVGIILKLFFTGRYEALSLGLYAVMGWMVVIKIQDIYYLMPSAAFWLMIAGGLTYTGGIVFYLLENKLRFSHFIWHLFVISGSVLHYCMISGYVI